MMQCLVFIAIIDTGINYSDEIFNDKYGNSRIFAIYDMENETEYDNEKISPEKIDLKDMNVIEVSEFTSLLEELSSIIAG